DDPAIAEVARAQGAEVPFMRDAALADDHTPTVPVIADACARLALDPSEPVCCLYATAPFVRAADLSAGRAALDRPGTTYALSVTTFPFPIQRALRRDDTGAVAMFDPSTMQTRSQDLEEAWHDAGQFYWARAETWTAQRGVFDAGALGVSIPRHRVQDIDTDEDWRRAEYMMQAIRAAEAEEARDG
ncbi:pseudaminic acid cytidylyltransferase, partial [Citreimonas sp.]|uniref:pseudaminic acid cytidylyltransferase n=1 Tax=Citreimonas sp. TaxID=3036715 RepID=UPI0035C7A1F6